MEYVLKTEGLTKKYGKHTVVDHVGMHVRKGDIYGFIGRNGAGKTTFMRMVSGLASPAEGTMELFGSCELEQQRVRIGSLIEQPGLYRNMTARENMEVVRRELGIPEKRAVDDMLEFVRLSGTGKKKVKNFSMGMKQRLGIAIALFHNPDFLILDEPTSGLDPYERIKFRNIISAYAKDRLVLLSTHIVSDVEHIAAQIMMMEYGVIQYTLTNADYIKKMDGRVWLVKMPAEQLVEYQNQAVISNVIARDDHMEVRIIDESKPFPEAVQAVPTLEDAYLYIFNYLPGKKRR